MNKNVTIKSHKRHSELIVICNNSAFASITIGKDDAKYLADKITRFAQKPHIEEIILARKEYDFAAGTPSCEWSIRRSEAGQVMRIDWDGVGGDSYEKMTNSELIEFAKELSKFA